MESAALDSVYALETPEGADLRVSLAGPLTRALAFVIDLLVRLLLLILIIPLTLLLGAKLSGAVWLLVLFLLEWWYPVLFEVFREGQTPGKKAMGIRVVQDDLTPVSFSASLTRNLLRAADFLPFGYLIGLASMTIHREFRRVGDMTAGTLVVYDRPAESEARSVAEAVPAAPPFALSEAEQRAFVEFNLRHMQLSAARQQELADILADSLPVEPARRIETIRGIGAWLLGAR